MLDNETKRRIDTARDILVGKVPDPKSQVEQITIALIYKFMDDMDREAVEFGGEAAFFIGDFKKYSWTSIFNPRLGGHEMLNLYSEGISKLPLHPSKDFPKLFRDIFKNAYLPYRDAETLKMFLKVINEFKYDHSERLGDAFEYLLSVLGSQGDAGQFRTPRHIIDFIVAVLQPKKNETICDPACGTAGFLISSYKYIVSQHNVSKQQDASVGSRHGVTPHITPAERKKMMNNFVGYDISPDMVRLSLVNMYLHNFTTPQIHEYDTLASEDRWGEYFDIIMANPPFMSPKGGIKPHKKFTMQANRSEVLFVDYIAEHINPVTGRAGIIVPEGIIFQSATAYKSLRKLLVDKNYLYAVVSLPAGIFQPYSGVKTSILFMDRLLAKKTDKILFVKIENDGFDLGAQRRAIDKNDLTGGLISLQQYKDSVINNSEFVSDNKNVFVVEKEKIAVNGDYNLSVDRYRVDENVKHSKWEMVRFQDFIFFQEGPGIRKWEFMTEGVKLLNVKNIVNGKLELDNSNKYISFKEFDEKYKHFQIEDGDIILASSGATYGKNAYFKNPGYPVMVNTSTIRIHSKDEEKISQRFIKAILDSDPFKSQLDRLITGAAQPNFGPFHLKQVQFPLPPLSIQQQIVDKIENYQRIIDGAKQVVENYKPQIDIDPEWEMVRLGKVLEKINDNINPNDFTGKVNYLGLENIESNSGCLIGDLETNYSEIKSAKSKFSKGNILYGKLRPNLNKVWLADFDGVCSTDIFVLRSKDGISINKFYSEYLRTTKFNNEVLNGLKGAQLPRVGYDFFSTILVPLPQLSIQQKIVNQIEQVQQLVNANKELIKIYEQKIKDEVNKLWEGKMQISKKELL